MTNKPIYGNWFSKDGLGPDPTTIIVWPLPEIRPTPPAERALAIRFDQTKAPGAFNMGHCPYGAGPMLYRRDVEELHRQLGAWLEATKDAGG